ncbi:MAG: methyltransferase, partial [Candidatus Competibacteraceae bacterium]|nr:methyltransferase [Candidatus Competibacteraceae bacterium]
EVQRPAVLLVHSDYTPKSGPQRVRDLLPAEADQLLQQRVAFFNVWKPLYRPVEELPLAMCDATTASDEDMLLMQLKYRERTGEIYVMRYSPSHRWYYFPNMTPQQALLLKTYDSET